MVLKVPCQSGMEPPPSRTAAGRWQCSGSVERCFDPFARPLMEDGRGAGGVDGGGEVRVKMCRHGLVRVGQGWSRVGRDAWQAAQHGTH